MTIQQPSKDLAPKTESSTTTMLSYLNPAEATHRLIENVLRLLSEKDSKKTPPFKKIIFELITTKDANVWHLWKEKSLLQILIEYYETKQEKDGLYKLLACMYHSRLLNNIAYQIFQKRNPDKIKCFPNFIYPTTQRPSHQYFLSLLDIHCENIDEAVFYAVTLENFLYQHLGIPFRSVTKNLVVHFSHDEAYQGRVNVRLIYRPEDYLKCTFQSTKLDFEKLLSSEYKNPTKDYYDFCNTTNHLKYLTRGQAGPCPKTHSSMDLEKIAMRALASPIPSQTSEFSANLLVITRTCLGYGNFINARLTLEGLCKTMPNIHIDWIIANDSDMLPTIPSALPRQISVYETDAIWKLYPLIRSLSADADIVLSLPNNFLKFAEKELAGMPLTLSAESIVVEVSEYNHVYEEKELGLDCLELTSGIYTQGISLGILKPSPLVLPASLDEKRAALCKDPKAAEIFHKNPNAPLYFAYVYQPPKELTTNNDIIGLKIADVLALFVRHAQSHHQKQIKIVLPIRKDTLQNVFETYPQIFKHCQLEYTDSQGTSLVLNPKQSSHKKELSIEVYQLFPFDNQTFRALMDYAAANHTPLVTTGDQSFFELFFTIPQGFVFLYQLLEHKKPLLDQIKSIMTTEKLSASFNLITMTEKGIQSEDDMYELVKFLNQHEAQLKTESLKLSDLIQNQPELTESLTKVIFNFVEEKRKMMAEEQRCQEPLLESNFMV